MNNITVNGNKVKRIYCNDKLVQNIKDNNKQVLGFVKTSELQDVAFNVTGSNWANTNLNSSFKVLLAGTSKITTKYICKGFSYVFSELPKSTGAILDAKFGINGVFEIGVEYYDAMNKGTFAVYVNGQRVGYDGYPNSIGTDFDSGKLYILSYKNDGKEQVLEYSFDKNSGDIENRFGYIELTSAGKETTERRGVDGYFMVCDQYPI